MASKEIPDEMLTDIRILLANVDNLQRIIDFQDHIGVGIHGLGRRMASSLSLDESVVIQILRALWRLQNYGERRGLNPAESVEWITTTLNDRASGEWKSKYLESWQSNLQLFKNIFEKIVDDHPLMITMKANVLAYSHQNILLGARLITDIRPVFDSTGEIMRDLVVTHMLSIEYTTGNQQDQTALTLAVDAKDIAALQQQCERAVIKTATVKKQLAAFNPIVMPDDEDIR